MCNTDRSLKQVQLAKQKINSTIENYSRRMQISTRIFL